MHTYTCKHIISVKPHTYKLIHEYTIMFEFCSFKSQA